MATRGTIKAEDYRIIYRSPVFPTSSFAHAHDLKPELAAKLKECFYSFRFTAEMQKEFNGDDRFLPITYAKDWAVVRDVAEKSGNALQQGCLRRGGEARGGCPRPPPATAAARRSRRA